MNKETFLKELEKINITLTEEQLTKLDTFYKLFRVLTVQLKKGVGYYDF